MDVFIIGDSAALQFKSADFSRYLREIHTSSQCDVRIVSTSTFLQSNCLNQCALLLLFASQMSKDKQNWDILDRVLGKVSILLVLDESSVSTKPALQDYLGVEIDSCDELKLDIFSTDSHRALLGNMAVTSRFRDADGFNSWAQSSDNQVLVLTSSLKRLAIAAGNVSWTMANRSFWSAILFTHFQLRSTHGGGGGGGPSDQVPEEKMICIGEKISSNQTLNGVRFVDLSDWTNGTVAVTSSMPALDSRDQWNFDPSRFEMALVEYSSKSNLSSDAYFKDQVVLLANVVNSTQTFLEQHDEILTALPDQSMMIAGHQMHGRGRGSNSWLSRPGCLQFTMVLHRPENSAVWIDQTMTASSTITLVQHLAAVCMARAVMALDPSVSLRLKWPNDIGVWTDRFVKLGGVLTTNVNSTSILVGIGINVFSSAHQTPQAVLADFGSVREKELLLAGFVLEFKAALRNFLLCNIFPFDQYYSLWIHTGQQVQIHSQQGVWTIVGIDHRGFVQAVCIDEITGSERRLSIEPNAVSLDMARNWIIARS